MKELITAAKRVQAGESDVLGADYMSDILIMAWQRDELLKVAKGLSHALNSARLIMADKEARAYAAELVNAAQMLITKVEAA